MPRKTIVIADPGIDTAFALALALNDPDLCVLGIIATAGNVGPDQATHNVRVIVEQLDPPRWPRIGAALPVDYDRDNLALHGPGGLGGIVFPVTKRDEPSLGDKVLSELIRESPHEVAVVNLGPLTLLARAFEREPDLCGLVERVVGLGGAWHVPGDVGPVVEFHFGCDPQAARQIVQCGAPVTLIPLDASRQIEFSPSDLLDLPEPEARTCQFLRRIVPFGIRASANMFGVEGFMLCDVLGIVALTRPDALTITRLPADVETRGEITRGQLVIDARPQPQLTSLVSVATGVSTSAVREYINDVLGSSV